MLLIIFGSLLVITPIFFSLTPLIIAGTQPTPGQCGKLHVDGRLIKDEYDRPVKLVGLNGHMSHNEDWAYQLYEEDIQWLVDRSFNVIRVVIYWEALEPVDDSYDMTQVGYLDNIVAWAETHDIYLILDFHQWDVGGAFGGYGFPDWITQGYTEISCAETFWSGSDGGFMQTKYIEFWTWLASRYVGKDVIFAYSLFNEPNNPFMGDPFLTSVPQLSTDLYRQVITAIRTVDSETIIICDVITSYDADGGASYYTDKIIESNVMYGRSWYDLTSPSHYGGYPDGNVPQSSRDTLRGKVDGIYNKFVVEFNLPFFLLEVAPMYIVDTNGVIDHFGAELWFNDTMTFFEDAWTANGGSTHEISFTWWRYCKDSSGWAPRLWSPPENPDTEVVPLLQDHLVSLESTPPEPPSGTLQCNAFAGSAGVTATVEVVGVGTYATPFTINLDVGNYTLNASYNGQTDTKTANILDGQTTTIDFQFTSEEPPTEEPPTEEPPTEEPNGANETNGIIPEITESFQGVTIMQTIGSILIGAGVVITIQDNRRRKQL